MMVGMRLRAAEHAHASCVRSRLTTKDAAAIETPDTSQQVKRQRTGFAAIRRRR